jgi:hypothetical protein
MECEAIPSPMPGSGQKITDTNKYNELDALKTSRKSPVNLQVSAFIAVFPAQRTTVDCAGPGGT